METIYFDCNCNENGEDFTKEFYSITTTDIDTIKKHIKRNCITVLRFPGECDCFKIYEQFMDDLTWIEYIVDAFRIWNKDYVRNYKCFHLQEFTTMYQYLPDNLINKKLDEETKELCVDESITLEQFAKEVKVGSIVEINKNTVSSNGGDFLSKTDKKNYEIFKNLLRDNFINMIEIYSRFRVKYYYVTSVANYNSNTFSV